MPENYSYPFNYGTVFLLDELVHLALRQELDTAQGSNPQNLNKAIKISAEIHKTLQAAAIKRDALFTKQSVDGHFGIKAAIKKAGI
jgi:hypothetical protein